MGYILLLSDKLKQWRHSSHFNVWLYSVADRRATAVGADGGPTIPPLISNVKFTPAPRGSRAPPSLAFVSQNDLYFLPAPGSQPIRITDDGAESIFNAVPDWVYEEEVFSGDSAMWFSPDGSKLAYLRFDETDVPIFEFPIYNANKWSAGQTAPYLKTTKMKYPKPGYPNPIVRVHVVDLKYLKQLQASAGSASASSVLAAKLELHPPGVDSSASEADQEVDQALAGDEKRRKERLVTEVVWVDESNLLVRESSRASDRARVIHYDFVKTPIVASGGKERELEGKAVRRISTKETGGWIEVAQTVRPLNTTGAYLEILPSASGFRHIAIFSSADAGEPVFITDGQWEVDGDIKHVDLERKRVYFVAAHPLPAERHVFYAEIPDLRSLSSFRPKSPVVLSDLQQGGWNDVSFDPKGAYYLLSHTSPNQVPSDRIIGIADPSFEHVLEDNRDLARRSAEFVMPTEIYYNVTTVNGTVISVKELRPHDFDASGRTHYPVLVNVYGGPNSQMVQEKWNRGNWHQYVACEMGYLVITIDGRGTGFRGRDYRKPVTNQLGTVEATDVSAAAAQLARLPYVDARRIGIWGWSFGGYLTAKVIERDAGVFNLGMSVAPVTSWRFYDSIYTERYMNVPGLNTQGYSDSGVHPTDGFRHAHFLLAQGSADDNVHFENSAHLLDMLTAAKVRGFRFRMFTDSDHSIGMRGAYQELHEFLLSFLSEKWGPGGKRRFRLKSD